MAQFKNSENPEPSIFFEFVFKSAVTSLVRWTPAMSWLNVKLTPRVTNVPFTVPSLAPSALMSRQRRPFANTAIARAWSPRRTARGRALAVGVC